MATSPEIQILDKCDEMFVALIKAQGGPALEDVGLRAIFDDNEEDETTGDIKSVPLPVIAVLSESSEEFEPEARTGNHLVEVSIDLMTHEFDTKKAQHRNWEGILGAIIFQTNIIDEMNALPGKPVMFTAIFWKRASIQRSVEEHVKISRFTGELWCIPSNE